MKKTIIMVLFLMVILSSFIDNENCLIMHKGTFKYGDIKEEVKVVIKDKKHTEYHNGGKHKIESELDWVNDCECNMTLKKITLPDFPFVVGDVMNLKITKIVGNEIFYRSTVKGRSWDGKLIKIQ